MTQRDTQPTPQHAPNKADALGVALKEATQTPTPLPLPANFAGLVAEMAQQRAVNRRKERLWLRLGFALCMLSLLLCGVIGLAHTRPTAWLTILDGPMPLVLTSLALMILGARFGNPKKSRTSQPSH